MERPKVVVATNVAQTSITINDIDAVVDSGVERRIELVDGIEGLYLKPISQADCEQRAGRAGRTKPGICVLCSDKRLAERPAFPTAEIERSRLDQLVLRLAVAGFDAQDLEFFHQPDRKQILEAKRVLRSLGAMTAEGVVTPIGKRMAKFPVSVQFSRMLVEAEKRGVVEQVATIAGCLEAGDIRMRAGRYEVPAWRAYTQEKKSDLLALYDLFEVAQKTRGEDGKSRGDCLRDRGIFAKNFFRASEIRRHILDGVRDAVRFSRQRFGTADEERKAVLLSCVAGMVDHLYKHNYGDDYKNGGNGTRQLAREIILAGRPDWIVGLPMDIEIQGRRGKFTLNLISMATDVDPAWLAEVAPQLVERKAGLNPRFDGEKDMVVSTTDIFFNGQKVGSEQVPDLEHLEATEVFVHWLSQLGPVSDDQAMREDLKAVIMENQSRESRARKLNKRAGENVFETFSDSALYERYLPALLGARRMVEVSRPEALALPALCEQEVVRVLSENPDTICLLGLQLPVEYREPYYGTPHAPAVALPEEFNADNKWLELPDHGVRLPGGRSVEVAISFGWGYTFSDTSIPQLKEKVREHLNKQLWEKWEKPAVPAPDMDHLEYDFQIPFITACYGKCVVTGEELVCFGTLRHRESYYDGLILEPVWIRDKEQSESIRFAAQEKLAEKQADALDRAEREEAREQVEAAKDGLRALSEDARDWFSAPELLREEAERALHSRLPSDSSAQDWREWAFSIKSLATKVGEAIDQVREYREAIKDFGWPEAYVFVDERGAAVNCGKSSKVGAFEVSPTLGEPQYGNRPCPDGERKFTAWQPIPARLRILCRDFSGSGNLNNEVAFMVPADLPVGMWSVAKDEEGVFFFSAVSYDADGEYIPSEVIVVREPASAKGEVTLDQIAALKAALGAR